MKRSSVLTTAVISALILATALVSSCNKNAGHDCLTTSDVSASDNVKAALTKRMPKLAKDINVEVKDKVATLSGHVPFEGSQTLAGETAKSVECIKEVVNKIVVEKTPGCPQGDHQCCCPDTGCECVPQSQRCNICSPK